MTNWDSKNGDEIDKVVDYFGPCNKLSSKSLDASSVALDSSCNYVRCRSTSGAHSHSSYVNNNENQGFLVNGRVVGSYKKAKNSDPELEAENFSSPTCKTPLLDHGSQNKNSINYFSNSYSYNNSRFQSHYDTNDQHSFSENKPNDVGSFTRVYNQGQCFENYSVETFCEAKSHLVESQSFSTAKEHSTLFISNNNNSSNSTTVSKKTINQSKRRKKSKPIVIETTENREKMNKFPVDVILRYVNCGENIERLTEDGSGLVENDKVQNKSNKKFKKVRSETNSSVFKEFSQENNGAKNESSSSNILDKDGNEIMNYQNSDMNICLSDKDQVKLAEEVIQGKVNFTDFESLLEHEVLNEDSFQVVQNYKSKQQNNFPKNGSNSINNNFGSKTKNNPNNKTNQNFKKSSISAQGSLNGSFNSVSSGGFAFSPRPRQNMQSQFQNGNPKNGSNYPTINAGYRSLKYSGCNSEVQAITSESVNQSNGYVAPKNSKSPPNGGRSNSFGSNHCAENILKPQKSSLKDNSNIVNSVNDETSPKSAVYTNMKSINVNLCKLIDAYVMKSWETFDENFINLFNKCPDKVSSF